MAVLLLPGFFDAGALKSVETDVEKMIDNLAKRCHKANKIKETHAGLDWTSRLLRMREEFSDAPVCGCARTCLCNTKRG